MTYETFLNVVHPDDRAYVDASWEIGMRDQPYDIEHRIVVDGMVKWVREKAYLEFDAEGQLLSGFGITQDITARVEARVRLEAALEEKNVLLQELYHRTKNNMHLIVSMLNMQLVHVESAAAEHALKDMQNRILSMALVHEKLYQSKSLTHVDLREYMGELVELLTRSYAVEHGRITVTTEMESMMVTIDVAIPCGLIANELVSNALQHAFPDGRRGRVELAVRALPKKRIELVVKDNGVGLPPGMEIRAVDSLGLHAVVALAEHQLGGSVEATRNDGTMFRVEFRVPSGESGG
jgi:two-component sensor histidine kinase